MYWKWLFSALSRLPFSQKKVETLFESRIRHLFFATFIIIGLYTCTATTVFVSLSRTRAEFVDVHVKKILSIKDLEVAIERSVATARTYILTKQKQLLDESLKQRDKYLTLTENLKKSASSENEVRLVSDLENSIQAYNNFMDVLVKMRMEDKPMNVMADYLEKNVSPRRRGVRERLANLESYSFFVYQKEEKYAEDIWHWNLLLFSVVAGFSLLSFAALRWALAKTVKKKKETEDALELSGIIFRQTVSLTGLGVFDHDHALQRTCLSPQLRDIFGLNADETLDISSVAKFIPLDEQKGVMSAIQRAQDPRGDGIYDIEHRIIRKNGDVSWVAVKGQTFFETQEDKRIPLRTIGAVLDITKQKKVEISLRDALHALAQEKLKLIRTNSELEQFASIAAHDLRAPIASMLGWAGLLDRMIAKPRDQNVDKAIQFITSNTRKADALIADLLEVARLNESGFKCEEIDLNKVLDDVISVLQETVAKTHAQIRRDPMPSVKGCLSHFESLFTNLLRNAMTYAEPGRPPKIEISYKQNGMFFEFQVQDNGMGIEEKYQSRIFEMFKRLHSNPEHEGTGIGLAYCKKVVELHGGRIWVESQLNQGSSFFFTYPMDPSFREVV